MKKQTARAKKKKRLSRAKFMERLKAGDPEARKILSEIQQELNLLDEAVHSNPYWKNFYKRNEIDNEQRESSNDWNEKVKLDVLDEIDLEILYPILQKLMDEALIKPPAMRKHKGRGELPEEEIMRRKKIVADAERIRQENPKLLWTKIADDLDVPERTLRDWRHNPIYK